MEIKIEGRTYPLLSLDDLTWGEWREAKRLSGGITPARFQAALADTDPDAWRAYALISMRRVEPSVKDDVLDSSNFMAAVGSWLESIKHLLADSEEGGAADPPPASPPSSSGEAATTPSESASNSSPKGDSPSSERTSAPIGA